MYRLRFFSTVRTVVVDYGNDPNANTGLFVKVVPEKLTSTIVAADPADSLAKVEKSVATAVAATTHHYRKTDIDNDELPTVRTVTVQKSKPDVAIPAGKVLATIVMVCFRNNRPHQK